MSRAAKFPHFFVISLEMPELYLTAPRSKGAEEAPLLRALASRRTAKCDAAEL